MLLRILFIFLIPYIIILANDWHQVNDFENNKVKALNCPDSNNCFALVQFSWFTRLYKSTNQGKSWNIIYQSDPLNESPSGLINSETGVSPNPDYYFIAMWDYRVIKKSTDGGSTFMSVNLDPQDISNKHMYIAMYDTNYGFASSGNNYYITKNGWESFEKFTKIVNPSSLYSPVFLDTNTILMPSIGFGNGLGSAFLKYDININKFDTLSFFEKEPDSLYMPDINDITFLNDSLGFACGMQHTGLGANKWDIIFRTKDGGYTWERLLKQWTYPSFGLQDIAFYDEENGVAVGAGGKIYSTNDGGDNWVLNERPPEVTVNTYTLCVAWAGRTPLIGTWDAGIFRYEGDFFDFSPDTSVHLLNTIPSPDEDSISVSTQITAKFFDILDTNKLGTYSYTIQNLSSTGEYIPGKYNFDFSDSTLIFTPDSSLPYLSIIQVNLNNIYDLAGNVLKQYSYTFQTEPDTTIGVDDLIKFLIGKIEINVITNNSQLYVSISDEHFRKYKLQIFALMGNVALEQELSSGVGTLYVPYDISGLTSGAYLYMISCEGMVVKTGKVILIQ
ncbi:MAG: Ig-like domain-containing protein [bacterium]